MSSKSLKDEKTLWMQNTLDKIGADWNANSIGYFTAGEGALTNLARESIQNSIDAVNNNSEPVKVKFEKLKMNLQETLPNADKFKKIFLDSCEYQRGIQDRNTKDSIEESIDFINKNFNKEIDVLKISDANTVGLTGAHKENERSRFSNLVFTEGSSLDEGPGGGSFGVGKNAPFAMSIIRTVIYSTCYIDQETNKKRYALAIKSILGSYPDQNNKYYFNTTVLTMNNKKTITDKEIILDCGLLKEDVGTDIYVLGIKINNKNFIPKLLTDISENYFIRFHKNKLHCVVKDGAKISTIDSKSIGDRLHNNSFLYSKDSRGNYSTNLQYLTSKTQNKPSSFIFYQAITDGDFHEKEIPHAGKVQLYIKFNPKNVEDKLMTSAQHQLRTRRNLLKVESANTYLSHDKPFVCIVTVTDEEGSSYFSALELQRHDSWTLHENIPPEVRENLKESLNCIEEWIKEVLLENLDEGKDFKEFPKTNVLNLTDVGNENPEEESQLQQEYEDTRGIEMTTTKMEIFDPEFPEVFVGDIDGEEGGPGEEEEGNGDGEKPNLYKYKRVDKYIDGWRCIFKSNNTYKLKFNINEDGINKFYLIINARSEQSLSEITNICERIEDIDGNTLRKNERTKGKVFFKYENPIKGNHELLLYTKSSIKVSPEVSFFIKEKVGIDE